MVPADIILYHTVGRVSAFHYLVNLVSHQEEASKDNYRGLQTIFPIKKTQANKPNHTHTESGEVGRGYAHVR